MIIRWSHYEAEGIVTYKDADGAGYDSVVARLTSDLRCSGFDHSKFVPKYKAGKLMSVYYEHCKIVPNPNIGRVEDIYARNLMV